jgi:Protein of unknown function (DUF3105)
VQQRRSGLVTAAALVVGTVAVLLFVLLSGGGGGSPSKRQVSQLSAAAAAAGCSVASFPSEGNGHTQERVEYKTNPPTSGDHFPVPAPDREYKEAPPPEFYVHTLEHGRIEFQYRPTVPASVKTALESVYREFTHHVLLFPNNTGMPYDVAATAWKHRLACPHYNAKVPDALRRFRDAYLDKGPEKVP